MIVSILTQIVTMQISTNGCQFQLWRKLRSQSTSGNNYGFWRLTKVQQRSKVQWNRAVLQLDNKVSHVVSDLDDKLDKKDRLDEIAEAEANSQGSYRGRPWLRSLDWTEPLCLKTMFRQSIKAERKSQ